MYRLIRFGTTNIEHLNQVEPIGSGPTPTAYQRLPEGGAIDGYGSRQLSPGAVERIKTMRLVAGSEPALESLYFTLLGLRGMRDKLYRRTKSGLIHWMYARLAEVSAARSYESAKYRLYQDMDLRLVCQEATWRGIYQGSWLVGNTGIYLDSAYALDTGVIVTLDQSPKNFTLYNGAQADPGRAPVRSIHMVIQTYDAALSGIIISRNGGESLGWEGDLSAEGQLIIDTGTMQVSGTGVTDPYDGLTLLSTADMAAWLTLLPGANSISVESSGAVPTYYPTIEFIYHEAWY